MTAVDPDGNVISYEYDVDGRRTRMTLTVNGQTVVDQSYKYADADAHSPDGNWFYAYDGNGNITTLVNTSDGAISATYDYSPFGLTVSKTGPAATANTITGVRYCNYSASILLETTMALFIATYTDLRFQGKTV